MKFTRTLVNIEPHFPPALLRAFPRATHPALRLRSCDLGRAKSWKRTFLKFEVLQLQLLGPSWVETHGK